MKKYWILILSGSILGLGFYSFLFYSHFGEIPVLPDQITGYLSSLLISGAIIFSLIGVNIKLDDYVSWKKYFILRFVLSTLISMVISLLIISCISGLYFYLVDGVAWEEMMSIYQQEILKAGILLFFLASIFNTGYFGFYSYQQFSVIQVSKIAQERKQLRLQFEALKSQLSPHYLFNSLNTISSLIYKDASLAEEFIRRLALTFKYVLTTEKQRLVPLKEEVEFIKAYYHLLKVRFGNSVNLEIDLPKDIMDTAIPPLTLQILIENAVKHNKFNQKQRLEINVATYENKFLRITNNKVSPAEDVRSFQVGLENIRKRYSFYSDLNIRIEDDEIFMVQLPLLKYLKKAG